MLIKTLKLISRLPLRALYAASDVLAPVVYHVVRYRRAVVRRNLEGSFPEMTAREIKRLERRFYRFFCDYTVETLKMMTMGADEMRRRMRFEGTEALEEALRTHPFAFVYLGHYGNWEWISSIGLALKNERIIPAQLYKPLKSAAFDKMFYDMRSKFGGRNISRYDSLRTLVRMKREGERAVVGFISDQSPSPANIHEWVRFLGRDTGVFTGTERIGKKLGAAFFFAEVERPRRGCYVCRFKLMTLDPGRYPDWQLTDRYMRELEAMIRRTPHLWLWTHKRWKYRREDCE